MEPTLYRAPLRGALAAQYKEFLCSCGLRDEGDAQVIALMLDDASRIAACGSLAGQVVKQIAVSPALEGDGASAVILSALINEAYRRGADRLFLCTKPAHRRMFSAMGFFPVVETDDALLMESRKNGLEDFLSAIPRYQGVCGAVVCRCDPFTLGHRHLIRYAADHCDHLYVFVVAESGSLFSPEERLEMVRRGTADLPCCHVFSSDAYLVSRATFPAYFIKDPRQADEVRSALDVALFARRIAPALGITRRFVGQEPFSPVTDAYNRRMKAVLPEYGISLTEIPRYESISASRVRALLQEGKADAVQELVPDTTYETILRHFG